MACGGCGQARAQFFSSARRLDIRGAVAAVQRGVQINVDKARGTYVDSSGQPVTKAKPYEPPYKRTEPPHRST